MDREPVASSNVESIGYDAAEGMLEVEFKGGAVYQYTGIPQELYAELCEAGSVGSFIHRRIKNAFACERIE